MLIKLKCFFVYLELIYCYSNTNSGNIRTCYSKTWPDYLIIKFIYIIVCWWYKICFYYETKSFLFHLLITFHFFKAGKKRAYLPLYVSVKTKVSCYKLCEENKSIRLQILELKNKLLHISTYKCKFSVKHRSKL